MAGASSRGPCDQAIWGGQTGKARSAVKGRTWRGEGSQRRVEAVEESSPGSAAKLRAAGRGQLRARRWGSVGSTPGTVSGGGGQAGDSHEPVRGGRPSRQRSAGTETPARQFGP